MSANNSQLGGSLISQSNIIQASYLILVILISVVGNFTIVFGIIRKRLLDDVTNCFILNLAISDFLNALLKMTTSVAGLFNRDWYPSKAICYLTTPFGVLFGAASVLSLTSVAVTRYLLISRPFTYSTKMTPSVAVCILGGVWLASILLSFPPATWRPVGIICQSGAVSRAYYDAELAYVVILWLFIIVVPSVVMMTSYFRIFSVTRKQLHRMSVTSAVPVARRQSLRRKRELRAAMVLALFGGVFILCWFPFFVILTIFKFGWIQVNPMYFKIFMCWMYTNSALNPLLLVVFNSEIRMAVRRVLPFPYRVDPSVCPPPCVTQTSELVN